MFELKNTYEYLSSCFTDKEISKLSNEIERVIKLIEKNPKIFRETDEKNGVRRIVVLKFNTLYYKINKDVIEIISFLQ